MICRNIDEMSQALPDVAQYVLDMKIRSKIGQQGSISSSQTANGMSIHQYAEVGLIFCRSIDEISQ